MREKIKSYVPVTRVYAWSCGVGPQFWSTLVFRLSTFEPANDLEFHNIENHHGKEPLDDFDGTIKNQVFNEAKSRRLPE